jgi:hypothetical protein
MNIYQENIARALRDEPLFAVRQWWCRFGIHTWLLWAKPVENARGGFAFFEQYRECGCCGRIQRRELVKY